MQTEACLGATSQSSSEAATAQHRDMETPFIESAETNDAPCTEQHVTDGAAPTSTAEKEEEFDELDNEYYPVQITADDLLPAIALVIIQANPPNIDSVLWLCSEFRHTELMHGEESFCLSQISSAVEFCR